MNAPPRSLRIAPAAKRPLTHEQKRFNALLRQLAQTRACLNAWQENLTPFRQSCHQLLVPLDAQLAATVRQWVIALDGQLQRKGWSRAERQLLREQLCEAAVSLLEQHGDDLQVKALHDKHAERDFDAGKRDALVMLKEFSGAMSSMDPEGSDALGGDEVLQRRSEPLAEEGEAERSARGPRQREAQAQHAAPSVRQIYRALASALHPDRETDPAERQRKTELLQKVNRAYDQNDLLTLLQTQVQIEQLDPQRLAEEGAGWLCHYNQLLAEQLDELREHIRRLDFEVRAEMAIAPHTALHPQRLGEVLAQRAQEIRASQAELDRRLRMLADRGATRTWLKQERRARRGAAPLGRFGRFGAPY